MYIHRTWGYETGSSLLAETGFSTMAEMDAAVKSAYAQAMKFVGADGIIPSGDAMLALSLAGIGRAHRDGFHASLGMGRYTLALTWFESIFGESCIGNSFRDFDEEISEDAVALCQRIAAEAVRGG